MPVFFQQQINDTTRLGIWKIEETEEFFKNNVPQHRHVTHPHKRLQHLAGRFLLQFLFPDFPYELIQIAETRKPYLPGEQYHFSISHCGDFAAAIVSRNSRVGIDIEIPLAKIVNIRDKFLSKKEQEIFNVHNSAIDIQYSDLTLLWSAKEAVFKWYGYGGVDFIQQIVLQRQHPDHEVIDCYFTKTGSNLAIQYRFFEQIVLTWIA